ncbi:MAG: 16S rRNA (uracil(1498)-N(3))-methyltransferase [Desulfobacterales bacterium]
MRYFFAEKIVAAGAKMTVHGAEARHAQKVLRLHPGDTIGLFDGCGTACAARIERFAPDGIVVEIIGTVPTASESPVEILMAQAFLKDKKMDGLARQLTELGVAGWMPFFAKRSIPAPDPRRLAGRLARWQKISREALKQCQRTRLMAIEPLGTLQDVLMRAVTCDVKILFWENQPQPIDLREVLTPGACPQKVFAIIGPEGGFAPLEVEAAAAEGFLAASLGPRILRAETAAVAAATLLQFAFGDMGKNP